MESIYGGTAGLSSAGATHEYAGTDSFNGSPTPNTLQVGWESGPTLALLAWEAQWLLYTGELDRKLTRPAISLPIFTDQVLCGLLASARA